MDRLPAPGPYLTVREGADGMLWALLRRGGVGNFVYVGVQRLEGRRWVPYPLAESLGPGETSMSSSSRAFLPVERDRVLIVGAGRLLDCRIRQGALEAQHRDARRRHRAAPFASSCRRVAAAPGSPPTAASRGCGSTRTGRCARRKSARSRPAWATCSRPRSSTAAPPACS